MAPSVQGRKVCLTPSTRVPCSNASKARNPLKFAGVPQTRSQPLVGQSSPYYQDMWRRYRRLTSLFPIVDTCLSCEDTARQNSLCCRRMTDVSASWRFGLRLGYVVVWFQSCPMVPKWRFFCVLYFSASRVQHISDIHSKFALRPHHVYGRHPLCNR